MIKAILTHLFYFFLLMFSFTTSYSQVNSYTQKKEFGLKGYVKQVRTYTIKASPYRISLDTTKYYSKSVLDFSRNGDLIKQQLYTELEDYSFLSTLTYKGTGKKIEYSERYKSNNLPFKNVSYTYFWIDALTYKLLSKEDTTVKTISLNNDFTIKKVHYKNGISTTEEEISYNYDQEGKLIATTSRLTTSENNTKTTKEDILKVQQHDVYNNPIVIYYSKNVDSSVPDAVIIKYYEYY